MRLKDRVAIVTGSGRGIGRGYAERLLAEGACVVIAEYDPERGESTARELSSAGPTLFVQTDVSNLASTEHMARATMDRFGRLDVLVNNAGLFIDMPLRTIDELPLEEWDRMMDVNVKGVWLCCRAVYPYMKAQGKGKIVNISSGTIFMARPNRLNYVASKAAVWGMTHALAAELGPHGINVNCVTPGYTETQDTRRFYGEQSHQMTAQMQIMKRVIHPSDLAGTIAFLASEDSDMIQGQTLNVDGGLILT